MIIAFLPRDGLLIMYTYTYTFVIIVNVCNWPWFLTNDRHILSLERTPHNDNTVTILIKAKIWSWATELGCTKKNWPPLVTWLWGRLKARINISPWLHCTTRKYSIKRTWCIKYAAKGCFRDKESKTGISRNRYYRVLTLVYNTQRYWVFGLCPSSGYFLNNNEKHNVSETGSVSVLRWGKTPTQLGPLERPNLNHWCWNRCNDVSLYACAGRPCRSVRLRVSSHS
jgi:hypothetical protein